MGNARRTGNPVGEPGRIPGCRFSRLSNFVKISENRRRVSTRRNLRIRLLYQAVLANDERAAQQSSEFPSITLLLPPRAVGFNRLAVGVR